MEKSNQSRRSFVGGTLGVLGLSALAKPALAADLTPRATEGPFYPTSAMRRADVDNDLVKILGTVQEAGGEVFVLKGRVLNRSGAPLVDRRIEIWQCDMNGRYLHTDDRQAIDFDPAFQGFGHDISGLDGSYEFRTIKPVTYPGRTPHIHVKVFEDGREVLTSQFYIDGHPANSRDRIFNRLSDSEAQAVSMTFMTTDSGEEAIVDVVV
ncbi:protocatechuate 3,4-dioxygenase [Labrenzia sp. OB1]|nr:protocatechuate 3,4-dioxygenase [Labrenzia sp. OB1]